MIEIQPLKQEYGILTEKEVAKNTEKRSSGRNVELQM
jgi:hypothetical protein